MNKTPSMPIKIVACIFLISAVLMILSLLLNSMLVIMDVYGGNANDIKSMAEYALSIYLGIRGILYFLAGWFLLKIKQWAYILGYILEILSLAQSLVVLIKTDTTGVLFISFLSAVTLVLLIIGRKDFRKKPIKF